MQPIFDFQPRPAASLWARSAPVAQLSAAVIDAVQQHGDLREEREDGTSAIRLSPEALQAAGLQRSLGPDALRALDVTLIWDDREDQLLQVIDAGPLRAPGRPDFAGPTGNPYADRRMRGFPRQARKAAAA